MPEEIEHPEANNSPALQISNIVRGRERRADGRVIYFADSEESEESGNLQKLIPEQIVLHRWRRRIINQGTCHGFRLSPNIWRSIGLALSNDAVLLKSFDEHRINAGFVNSAQLLGESNFSTPRAGNLFNLLQSLKVNQLQEILNRHLDPERSNRYGTPDLFLYALNQSCTKTFMSRFVEVKKPNEPLSLDQIEEIHFLRNLGLKARVLRLEERT
ncbi:VRR-NUC domain-containing protein [Candidatus Peregrinibacteria bacterium]|jgi:hypothetical protein|nr:VRR-NUC domain-containing protein [Candidatus Peregrinibacteria bacterium]